MPASYQELVIIHLDFTLFSKKLSLSDSDLISKLCFRT